MGEFAGRFLEYDVAEVVVFSRAVNLAQRTIIENYLSAKYDIALSGTDVYAGDTGANGDYDRGMFGVGRESASDFHQAAETDGLGFDNPTGLDNGDYLTAGYAAATNSAIGTDINGVGGLEERMERTWYVDRSNDTNGDLTADVTVTLTDAGLAGPAGDAGNYVLLSRPAGSSAGDNWTSLGTATSVADNDAITFSGVSISDGDEITLGTTDAVNSPIDTNSLVITGTAGTDGNDQGWRYLGLPVTGATASDLLGADGTPFIDFNVQWMAYTNDGGDVQGASSGWTEVDSGTEPLANGRGFILWLYDDPVFPINPTLTLQVASGLSAPGANDVDLGDNTPSDDVPLSTGNAEFLLANPYAVPYALSSLGTPASDEFDTTVQIWEADATQSGNDPAQLDDENVGSFVARDRNAGDLIAPWQGFLLTRTNPGTGSQTQISFGNAGRSGGSDVPFIGSNATTAPTDAPQHRIPLVLKGRDDGGALLAVDRAASVLFHENATPGRDRYDAPKLEPMTSDFATLAPVASDGTTLRSQEGRPLPDAPVDIPLAFQTTGLSGTFSIGVPTGRTAAAETYSAPGTWEVILIDTKGTADPSDDATHPLAPGGAPYTFSVSATEAAAHAVSAAMTAPDDDAVPAPRLERMQLQDNSPATANATMEETTAEARFLLRVRPTAALPVELADINATISGSQVAIEWTTASETNNSGFQVEHQRMVLGDSTSAPVGSRWTSLGFVEGQGTTTAPQTYRFQTGDLDYGRHVFRLRQVDTDGTETTTEPLSVTLKLQDAYAIDTPYPNPARQRATLPITVRETQRVTVELFDLLGRRVATPHDAELQGQDTRRVQLRTERFSSGVYFIRVRGESFVATRRLTVVR